MRLIHARTLQPNHNCKAPNLYQNNCPSNQWSPQEKQVDLRVYIQSQVLNQGLLNSCSGCAISAAVEITLNRENQRYFDDCGNGSKASAMFIYYNERVKEQIVDENSPVLLSGGFNSLLSEGVCCADLWVYPDTKVPESLSEVIKTGSLNEIMATMNKVTAEHQSKIDSYLAQTPSKRAVEQAKRFNNAKYCKVSIENGIDEVKHALSNHTPVIFGFIEPQSFFDMPASGLMKLPSPKELRIGGHAVCAVGFDDEKQALLIRNSYGEDFGLNGYFYMPYEFVLGSYHIEGQEEPKANAFDFYCLLDEK